MRSVLGPAAFFLLLGGCQTGTTQEYALGAGEKGVFSSRNAGAPIPPERIKGLDDQQLAGLFGAPQLDRKDGPARVLRYKSDACTLFVTLYQRGGQSWRAEFADAYDTYLRPLPPDQCAGSVAAQRQRTS